MVGRIGVGSICDLWVRFVICGCGFVLWCVVGFFLFFFFFFLLWTGGGGGGRGCGCGCG